MASSPTHQEIAQLAYQLWIERGRPEGTPEIDWEQAEGLLRLRMAQALPRPVAPAETEVPIRVPPASAVPGKGRRGMASSSVAPVRAARSTRQGAPHGEP